MKIGLRVFSLLLSYLLLLSSEGFAAPTVTLNHTNLRNYRGKYFQRVDYPQIHGLSNATVEKSINAMLAHGSWPKDSITLADIEPGERIVADIKCAVSLNQQGLLSIMYSGLQVLTKNGKMISAHPSKLINSYTIDLKTGKIYTWSDLFKAGSQHKDTISAHVKKEFDGYDPDELNASSRSFFLTPRSLVIIFPNAIHAIQGSEVSIPLKDLTHFANPNGPLRRLLTP